MMSEAEALAEKTRLPVLVGRNERLLTTVFDDSVVSVVCVPTERHAFFAEEVELGGPQVLTYVDDYTDVMTAVLRVDHNGITELHNPVVMEQHMVRFAFRTAMPGDHVMTVVVGTTPVFDGTFRVVER